MPDESELSGSGEVIAAKIGFRVFGGILQLNLTKYSLFQHFDKC